MSRLLKLVCVLVGLLASASQAAPRLVVVPFSLTQGVPGKAPERFLQVVELELKGRSDSMELVAAPATRPVAPEPSAGSSGVADPAALKALKAGEEAFDELSFDTAVAQLKKGIDGLLADPASADMGVVLDANIKLAAAYFRMGEEKKAKQALADLARISTPDFALPAGFPPIFQREFDKARKRLDRKPKGKVAIDGPPGATAFLDGRDLGMVPALEENIPAGTHYVKVEGGKGQVFGQAVEVVSGVVKVKATFHSTGPERRAVSGLADPEVGSRIDGATLERLAAYTRAAGADYALVGVIARTNDTQLTLYPALFFGRKQVMAQLDPVEFDVQVVSAAPEAFRLAEDIVPRLLNFGEVTSVPFTLLTGKSRGSGRVVARVTPKDDVEVAGPQRGRTTILVPENNDVRALDRKSNLVDLDQKDPDASKGPVIKRGVPTWVWVVAGVAAAAGAGVGGYFVVSSATRPVTGTVNATW